MDKTLGAEDLNLFRKEFTASPTYRLAQNAVTRVGADEVALDREIVNAVDHSTTFLIDDWKVTNQKQSGRCWLFAGLNLLRAGVMKKTGIKNFEFSQNHTMFWDKLERANYFLEAIIETSDRDQDDRTIGFLLDSVAGDGGQWNMFVALVEKHGLVPQAVMPETQSSSSTRRMDGILQSLLRQGARTLRAAGSVDEARAEKADILKVIHRVLCIHLGTPPETFDWQWTDKDRVFHRDGVLTPQEFRTKYVDLPLDQFVCLVDDPRHEKGKTYTVDYLGNVLGAPPVVYLNVDIALMKKLASETIEGGEPVWFGCDVGPMMHREMGMWDAHLFDYPGLYDTDFSLEKADRLHFHQSAMTHAMLFTGVDVLDGTTRRWRVENSWGDENGKDGYYTMNDNWFDQYVFEIAARRSALPEDLQAALDQKPTVLPAWDPMGSLAR